VHVRCNALLLFSKRLQSKGIPFISIKLKHSRTIQVHHQASRLAASAQRPSPGDGW
jgi:hypothetical protein